MINNNNIVVTGATGNIGSKVAEALLHLNCNITVNGRNKEKLEAFKNKARIVAGDLEDDAVLNGLLENKNSVFLVLPALKKRSIQEFAEYFIKAATDNKVSHVVNISNCTLKRLGQPTAHIEFEQHLSKAKSIHMKHLRCANFFENLNWGIHTPYNASIKLPYISSFEVAHIASQYLFNRNFSGISTDEIMGKHDYSMKDFADELGVAYKQLEAPEEWKSFFDAFNSGDYELVKRTEQNTSKLQSEKFTLQYFLNNYFDRSVLDKSIL